MSDTVTRKLRVTTEQTVEIPADMPKRKQDQLRALSESFLNQWNFHNPDSPTRVTSAKVEWIDEPE